MKGLVTERIKQNGTGKHGGIIFSYLAVGVIIISMRTLAGCAPKPTPTAPSVYADSTFSGQALLDANGNGQIDPDDTPVANATFYVEINGVKAFGETTNETGNAFILIPGSMEYPVKVSMEAPKNSTLKLITPSPVTMSPSTGTAQFLFSSK